MQYGREVLWPQQPAPSLLSGNKNLLQDCVGSQQNSTAPCPGSQMHPLWLSSDKKEKNGSVRVSDVPLYIKDGDMIHA
jgi:hypothetical protein